MQTSNNSFGKLNYHVRFARRSDPLWQTEPAERAHLEKDVYAT